LEKSFSLFQSKLLGEVFKVGCRKPFSLHFVHPFCSNLPSSFSKPFKPSKTAQKQLKKPENGQAPRTKILNFQKPHQLVIFKVPHPALKKQLPELSNPCCSGVQQQNSAQKVCIVKFLDNVWGPSPRPHIKNQHKTGHFETLRSPSP